MSAQAVSGITGGLLLTGFADHIPAVKLLGWGALLSGLLMIPLLNYPLLYPVLWPSLVLVAIALCNVWYGADDTFADRSRTAGTGKGF